MKIKEEKTLEIIKTITFERGNKEIIAHLYINPLDKRFTIQFPSNTNMLVRVELINFLRKCDNYSNYSIRIGFTEEYNREKKKKILEIMHNEDINVQW